MKEILAWLMSLFTVTTPMVLPVPSPQSNLITHGEFRYASVTIDNLSRLQLYSNLEIQENAVDLAQKKDCGFLTNAGFYDTSNRHLGWFYTEGQEISPSITNRLFDGYLFLKSSKPQIGFEAPAEADWGVQSGPVLIYGGQPLNLSIINDQPRRRVVAGLDQNNQLIFYIILSFESDYAGPLLADLPQLVKSINPQIVSAINLDGGSASAFLSEAVILKEYSPIGGYFCYTKP